MFANEVLVCFLFPIHAGLHRAYHLFTTVIHNGTPPSLQPVRMHLGTAEQVVGGGCAPVSLPAPNWHPTSLGVFLLAATSKHDGGAS